MLDLLKRPVSVLVAAMVAVAPIAPAFAQDGTFSVHRSSAVGNYLAGLAALDNFEAARAASYFMEAAETDWDNPVYSGQAFLAYLMAGQITDAADMARHVLDLNPDDELARLTLGTVALKQRRYASAGQILGRIPNGSLVGITGGIMRAWAHLGDGNLAMANATLDDVGQGGFEEFLVFHRAVLADLGGDRDAALQLAQRAYELDPFVPRIAEAYIRILGNAGEFERAQEILDSFEAEGVAHPVVDVLREPIAAGRKPGLFAENVQAGASEMLHGLGTALARDGSRELAAAFLHLAAYLDTDSPVVAMSLGELLSAAGRYEEADATFASVPESSPLHISALIRRAETLDLEGDREAAISRLQNIVTGNPGNQEAYGVLGDILRYDQQWEAAAEAYSGIIDQLDPPRPRDWRFYYVRGISYERADMWDLAEADFLEALELNPGHPDVLNYLGYTWVDRGEHLDEALDMIERAVDLSPRNGYIVDSLGWAFYKLGRIDEAVETLETAVSLLPGDPEVNDHLGDVYWAAGRQREAMFQWRIAIDVDEEGNVTERATPKLTDGIDLNAPIGD